LTNLNLSPLKVSQVVAVVQNLVVPIVAVAAALVHLGEVASETQMNLEISGEVVL
jgi:hypothetical protein